MLTHPDDLIHAPVREKGSVKGQQHQREKGHAGKAPLVGAQDNKTFHRIDSHGVQIGKAKISASKVADHPHAQEDHRQEFLTFCML